MEKDKDIDLELLQDLMEVDIDPLDIDLEKDPLAAKVFKVWHSRVFRITFTCAIVKSFLSYTFLLVLFDVLDLLLAFCKGLIKMTGKIVKIVFTS